MKKAAVLLGLFGLSTFCGAEVTHRFMANCVNKGVAQIVNTDGSVEWKVGDLGGIHDSWLLENGNFLFSHKSGVREVSPDKKVVWEYTSPAAAELQSVQPIEDGKVLACECGTKRLIELDRAGEIVKEIPLQSDDKVHTQFRTARKTVRGTYWVAYIGQGKVRELDSDGKTLREITVSDGSKNAHSVQELANGHLVVSTANGYDVKEFDADGKLVWRLSSKDMLAAGVKSVGYIAGVERLANGNTIVSMYHGNPQFFEVTPAKKIVWQYHNESFGNISSLCLLD